MENPGYGKSAYFDASGFAYIIRCLLLCGAVLIHGTYHIAAANTAPVWTDHLDIGDLPPGRHHFFIAAGSYNNGIPVPVPVMVLKGAREGKRLLLTAAVHGDELNGIRVIHQLFEDVDAQQLSGAIIAIPGFNQPGIHHHNRRFQSASGGGSMADLNRMMPGTQNGSAAARYIANIWEAVIAGNVDIAIDLHTQTRGTAYPLFVFADNRNATIREMAYDLHPDVIKRDAGQKGSLETTLVQQGIPAVTFELGSPKRFQPRMINRAVSGIKNVMTRHMMLAGTVPDAAAAPLVGNAYTNIVARTGGYAVLHVDLLDRVEKGQKLVTVYDSFGIEIQIYDAPHDGHVLAVATDPVREPGSMLVRILK